MSLGAEPASCGTFEAESARWIAAAEGCGGGWTERRPSALPSFLFGDTFRDEPADDVETDCMRPVDVCLRSVGVTDVTDCVAERDGSRGSTAASTGLSEAIVALPPSPLAGLLSVARRLPLSAMIYLRSTSICSCAHHGPCVVAFRRYVLQRAAPKDARSKRVVRWQIDRYARWVIRRMSSTREAEQWSNRIADGGKQGERIGWRREEEEEAEAVVVRVCWQSVIVQ